jgi:transposase-like protein
MDKLDGLLDPRFTDPDKAAEYLESVRWPDGPRCPHCGEHERKPYRLAKSQRRLWKCAACRKQFTVTVGTIFHGSHIPLNKWLAAFYLLCSSKKGMSAHQLHRMLNITYKSAWFMCHRIRYAMEQPPFQDRMTGIVEADETYIGGKRRYPQTRPWRATDPQPAKPIGIVRSQRVANVTGRELKDAIRRNVDPSARIMTDQFPSYRGLDLEFASHEWVTHRDEWVRGDVHTNTAENYFSILKRGIDGVYHHVSEAHLPRYLAEFDFRYSNRIANGVDDTERTRLALAQTGGKRLSYRETLHHRRNP